MHGFFAFCAIVGLSAIALGTVADTPSGGLRYMGIGYDGYGESTLVDYPMMTWEFLACAPTFCYDPLGSFGSLESHWASMDEQTWTYQCPPDPCDTTAQGHKTIVGYRDYYVEYAQCEMDWATGVGNGYLVWRVALGGGIGMPITFCDTTFTGTGITIHPEDTYSDPSPCRPQQRFTASISFAEYQAVAPDYFPEAPPGTMASALIYIYGTAPEPTSARMTALCQAWMSHSPGTIA